MSDKPKIYIYLFGFIRNKGHRIKPGLRNINRQLAPHFDISYVYYGPEILNEFDKKPSQLVHYFPSGVKISTYPYVIQKYVDICKKNELLIRNNKNLYPYRIISFYDQLLEMIRIIKESDSALPNIPSESDLGKPNIPKESYSQKSSYLFIRVDQLDVRFNITALREYVTGDKSKKIYGRRTSDNREIEDRLFILNNYSLDRLGGIDLQDIIRYCADPDTHPERILFDLLKDEDLEYIARIAEHLVWIRHARYEPKYSEEYYEKIKKLFE